MDPTILAALIGVGDSVIGGFVGAALERKGQVKRKQREAVAEFLNHSHLAPSVGNQDPGIGVTYLNAISGSITVTTRQQPEGWELSGGSNRTVFVHDLHDAEKQGRLPLSGLLQERRQVCPHPNHSGSPRNGHSELSRRDQ